jgi:hypothetical protein
MTRICLELNMPSTKEPRYSILSHSKHHHSSPVTTVVNVPEPAAQLEAEPVVPPIISDVTNNPPNQLGQVELPECTKGRNLVVTRQLEQLQYLSGSVPECQRVLIYVHHNN